ncbi:hypothetical protein AA15669_0560 [Saccharibacter floricola DSM 15669]|uniref:Uncharacterized protein n=1 Tax=Saccharibacter floricola DSM 15669 TaxID=1123227 RepID=A0ABQ0NXV9_9PROT|nr:hypothetical protein AA15669_0560 [Saccharibacter floricola DSM 15669]
MVFEMLLIGLAQAADSRKGERIGLFITFKTYMPRIGGKVALLWVKDTKESGDAKPFLRGGKQRIKLVFRP